MAARADDRFDALRRRFNRRLRRGDRFTIVAYRGYGSPRMGVRLRGRVLEGSPAAAAQDDDTLWDNLLAAYRRLESDEVAGATVEIDFCGATRHVQTDSEGFYDLTLEPASLAALQPDVPWQTGIVRLIDPFPTVPVEVAATALVPSRAEFGVISDIDDTVLVSEVRNLVRTARLLFLNNARTRLPFPGVPAFYRALQRCAGSPEPATACCNPIFYVSSSPWNLYDLLIDFMALNEIPAGPLFLRDFGLHAPAAETAGHHGHKLARIEEIFAAFPSLPFVLIGDSGQRDPEIYAEAVRRHGARVRAIYIRDVVEGSRRDLQVARLGQETAARGVPMLLVPDTAAAEAHARSLGLITA